MTQILHGERGTSAAPNTALQGDVAASALATLQHRGLTLAVAESLTGGLLTDAFVSVPGASAVLLGGVVAYNTALKATVLGVDAQLLAEHGPVHPDVAAQMALGVRAVLAVGGADADIGMSTTGVAGPGPQDGHPAGTAFVAIAMDGDIHILRLSLQGGREAIRKGVVRESLKLLNELL